MYVFFIIRSRNSPPAAEAEHFAKIIKIIQMPHPCDAEMLRPSHHQSKRPDPWDSPPES